MEEAIPRDGLGIPSFAIQGPSKTVPRIDYERIFVLDEPGTLLGEYVLRDDCPLEFADFQRAMPLSGMRHLVAFYQGEYAFTPFRVENLWFVVLTHGIPRIEERGSIGTLLAAMRVHLPPLLSPAFAAHEERIREREREIDDREAGVARREQRVTQLETDLKIAAAKLKDWDSNIRGREIRLNSLRDYAIQMQREFYQTRLKRERPPAPVEGPTSGDVPPSSP